MSIRPQNELRHNHLAAVLLAAVLVLPALFWGPQHPQFVHLALLGLVVEVLLLVWLLRRELPLRGIRSFLSSGANPYLLAYLGWSAASLAYGLDRRAAEAGCLQLAFGVLLYAIIALEFRERAQIRRLLGALLALAVGPV
ncbi:MAG: hypothetical protein FJX77_15910, partial [Armatimonadetes bacterium]|nr:hypothetical protein [Armatimonadota bacterium]